MFTAMCMHASLFYDGFQGNLAQVYMSMPVPVVNMHNVVIYPWMYIRAAATMSLKHDCTSSWELGRPGDLMDNIGMSVYAVQKVHHLMQCCILGSCLSS